MYAAIYENGSEVYSATAQPDIQEDCGIFYPVFSIALDGEVIARALWDTREEGFVQWTIDAAAMPHDVIRWLEQQITWFMSASIVRPYVVEQASQQVSKSGAVPAFIPVMAKTESGSYLIALSAAEVLEVRSRVRRRVPA